MERLSRVLSLGLGAGALVVSGLAATPAAGSAEAPARTCHGKRATIVGSDKVRGTNGPDVIVLELGRRRAPYPEVEARGGDDTICVLREVTNRHGMIDVDAGPGDDYVENRTVSYANTTVLGAGDDEFVGGPGTDWVYDGSGWWDTSVGGVDSISSGGGEDVVHTGELDAPNRDVVHTGAGDDVIAVRSLDGAGAVLDGGAGHDRLSPELVDADGHVDSPDHGAWVFDNTVGAATLDGVVRIRWRGMEGVKGYFGGDTTSFVGSVADESFEMGAPGDADMGGGDDSVVAHAREDAAGSSFVGGPGSDRYALLASDCCGGSIVVDAAEGRFTVSDGPDADPTAAQTWQVEGFESYLAAAPDVTMHGAPGPDVLVANGCRIALEGGDGDDRLTGVHRGLEEVFFCSESSSSLTIDGGADDDVLRGSNLGDLLVGGPGDDVARGVDGDDVLRGGTGRDTAVGGAGRDRCSAEVRRTCER